MWWKVLQKGGEYLGRVLFGSKPLTRTAEKQFWHLSKHMPGGWKQRALIAKDVSSRALKQFGARAVGVGTTAYMAHEAIDAIGGGTTPQQGGIMNGNGYVGDPSMMGPMQPPGVAYRWPLPADQRLRGYARWVGPYGNIYFRKKRRRMNPLNPRALRRAHTRCQAFEKFVMRNFSITRRSKVKPKRRCRR
jgi:hypothetical protein